MSTDSTSTAARIAVVGATGQQGGAVASALLEKGALVKALVRDPDAPAAQSLVAEGAQLAVGDLTRPDSLVQAFEGVEAVFAMTTFTGPDGTRGEVENGRAIGEAVHKAGVRRVVYSSVGGAERETGIPHFESKRRVEERLQELGLDLTVIRPAFFMDNFASFSRPSVEDGTLVVRLPLPEGIPLQMVAVRDIGRASAHALLAPEDVPGGALELAGDERTGEEMAEAFGAARDLPARYEALPLSTLDGDADQQSMFSWFSRLPAYQADFAASRALVPDLLDLPGWLRTR